jgi:hypothetical protein
MRRLTFAAVLIALALPASPAGAANPVLTSDGRSIGLVTIAGDGVLWASSPAVEGRASDVDGPVLLRRQRPGGKLRDVATVGRASETDLGFGATTVTQLDASGGHALVRTEESIAGAARYGDVQSNAVRVLELAGGRLSRIAGCAGSLGNAAALSWPRLALTSCDAGAITLRDLATPDIAASAIPSMGGDLRLAGSMLAIRTADAIVVRDIDAGADVLRIELSTLPGALAAWSLQADGTVAFATGQGSAGSVAWASPAQPALHVIDSLHGAEAMAIAGDRIVVRRGPLAAGHPNTTLSELTLGGLQRQLAQYDSAAGGFDADATHVVYVRRHCLRDEIVVRSFEVATPDIQHVTACPLFVDAALAEATPRRRGGGTAHVAVAATCPLLVPARASDVCDVRATLERRGRRIASTHTRIRPGAPSGRLRFALPASVWRARPATLRILVRTKTRGGVRPGAVTIRPIYEP